MSITGQWHLVAALIFSAAVFLDRRKKIPDVDGSARPVLFVMLLYMVNATIVHFVFADNPEWSWYGLQLQWKQLGLLFLITLVIRDKFDLELLISSILVGSTYIAYEIVVNNAGSHEDGEWGGNHIAAWLSFTLPLGGYLLFYGSRRQKLLAAGSLLLTLEFVLGTASRGAYLSVIAAAVWLVVGAKGRIRKYALAGVVLGAVAAFLQMGSDREFNTSKFLSIFASEEQRDDSSQSRIEMWKQGVKMIDDHPLGSGYESAFKSDLGQSYIAHFWDRQRSVHNGYIELAASWGLQGAFLFLAALAVAWRQLGRSISAARASGNDQAAFLGCCLRAALITQVVASTFGTNIWAEQVYWWMALAVTHQRILLVMAPVTRSIPVAWRPAYSSVSR